MPFARFNQQSDPELVWICWLWMSARPDPAITYSHWSEFGCSGFSSCAFAPDLTATTYACERLVRPTICSTTSPPLWGSPTLQCFISHSFSTISALADEA